MLAKVFNKKLTKLQRKVVVVLAVIVLLLCLNKKNQESFDNHDFEKCVKEGHCNKDPEFQKDCMSEQPKNMEECEKCAKCMGTTIENVKKGNK